MIASPDTGEDVVRRGESARCIWMAAGILSYQLCDREFDCEHCPLDSAMRTHCSLTHDESHAGGGPNQAGPESNQETPARYSRNHLWLRQVEGGTSRIGMEAKLARILPPVKAVIIPQVGQVVTPGSYCFWVIAEGGVLQFRSPVSGILSAVNPKLADHPHFLQLYPGSSGWIFDCLASDLLPSSSDMAEEETADRRYQEELALFKDALSREVHQKGGTTARTMADGGEVVGAASAILGAARYLAILKQVFLPDG